MCTPYEVYIYVWFTKYVYSSKIISLSLVFATPLPYLEYYYSPLKSDRYPLLLQHLHTPLQDQVDSRKELWYADSGASCHMTNDKIGHINVQENLNEKVMVGDGTTMTCTAKGSLRLRVYIKGIKKVGILLKEVLYVPEMKNNLFSLSGMTRNGVNVNIKRDSIVLGGVIKESLPLFERFSATNLSRHRGHQGTDTGRALQW